MSELLHENEVVMIQHVCTSFFEKKVVTRMTDFPLLDTTSQELRPGRVFNLALKYKGLVLHISREIS